MNPARAQSNPGLDTVRYRRVLRFFLRTFLHLLWWDVFMNRPVLRWLRPPQLPRWESLARAYRNLALDLGGVLIKLGQFLSVRVDVLPVSVVRELADLRDQVPAVDFVAVQTQLEADLAGTLDDRFSHIDKEAVGAASLAQVHRARLADGAPVVLKVLRPGIREVVETDLSAISRALRWLKLYRRISNRVDLDALGDEFGRVTRAELDTSAEGRNAERFARDFDGDDRVYIPHVLWEHSGENVLTMEDVGFVPIDAVEELQAAGIDEKAVAATFFDVFLKQLFETSFVHVDLHGGNAFVRPLATAGESGAVYRPGDLVPHAVQRPFQIALVDFGMMAVIPEVFRASIRECLVGISSGDARRMVRAYQDMGVLLPGADVELIEHATADFLQRFSDIRMGQIRDMAFGEAMRFVDEYRELIYEAPFQFPVDLLFIFRAAGLLSGLTTHLDSNFSPVAAAVPFAQRLAKTEMGKEFWVDAVFQQLRLLYRLPARVDEILTRLERGTLKVQTALAPDTRQSLNRLQGTLVGIQRTLFGSALLLVGTALKLGAAGTTGAHLLMGVGGVIMIMGWLTSRAR